MKSVFAPVVGKPLALEDTGDPVFSEKMLGDGYAIEPINKPQTVYSPVDGKITVINEGHHAFSLSSVDGLDLLLHVGVDTIELNGKGFQLLCKAGQKVKVGDPLVEVDFPYVKNYATASTVFIIVTNATDNVRINPTSLGSVDVKALLFAVQG
jgi:sugar PTS system EIIA component